MSLDPHELKPEVLGAKNKMGAIYFKADGAVAANDVIVVSGRDDDHPLMKKADADTSALSLGTLWVSAEGVDSGEYGVARERLLVQNVNTSGSVIGNPVYLSSTAGGWTLTAPAHAVVVGEVLEVHATTGAILLAPQAASGSNLQIALVADPGAAGAIPVTRSGICEIVTAAAEARSLAIPSFSGQRLTLVMKTDGGDCTITAAAAINQASNTTITMNDAGDTIHLIGATIGAGLRWRVISNDGCTLG